MKVEIKNLYLRPAIDMFFSFAFKGKNKGTKSRHRTKFIKLLNEQFKDVEKQRLELVKEYAKLDDEGEPISKNGKYQFPSDEIQEEFDKEVNEMYQENFVIEGGNNEKVLKTVKEILLVDCEKEDFDKVFVGAEATVYDYLCEQFEELEDKKKGEGKK